MRSEAPVYHLGIYREKVSLQPVECKSVHLRSLSFADHVFFPADYSKLPESPPVDLIYILDPLIATGGTATAALHMIKDWGIPGICIPFSVSNWCPTILPFSASKIKLLCILASEVGLKRVQTLFPDIEVGAAPRTIDGAYSHVG